MARPRQNLKTTSDGLSESSYLKLAKELSPSRLGLYGAAAHICRSVRIPKSTTRSGLRRVHARLPAISRQLCSIFDMAALRKEWHICNAVTVIWVEMCADASLCHGLLEEGLLPRTLRLVDVDGAFMLLNLLSLLARHGNDAVKSAVLRGLVTILANWKTEWRSLQYNTEYVLVTLCHCIGVAALPQAHTDLLLPPEVSVNFVADLALSALEDPDVSHETIIHAIPLLIACVRNCSPRETTTRVRILDFIAVLLHSQNVTLRCVSAWVFCGLPTPPPPRHRSSSGSGHSTNAAGSAPCNAVHGAEQRSAKPQIIVARNLLQKAVTCDDFYEFGVGIAHFLSDGPSLHEDDGSPISNAHISEEYGPWHSYLPEAIETLRRREHFPFLDVADILSLEHLSRCASPGTASSHARAVLKRNPTHAYAYFTLCKHSENREEALRAAIEGLRSADLTPYLRRRLEAFAIEHSFAKASTLLLQTGPSDLRRRKAGQACLSAVMDYAATFVLDAPDDLREQLRILDLTIMQIVVSQGHNYPPELDIIKPFMRRSERITRTLGDACYKEVEGSTTTGPKALVHHFSRGYNKWATVVERFDELDERHRAFVRDSIPDTSQTVEGKDSDLASGDDEFAHWWEPHNEITLASLLRGPLRCSCHSSEDRSVQLGPGLAMLYACSWCSCRTAMVRKCARCQDAWYCNAQCQRADWPQHRKLCYGWEEPAL